MTTRAAALAGSASDTSTLDGPAPGRLSPRRIAPFALMEVLVQAQQWLDLVLLGLFVAPAELALYALARALTRALDQVRGAAAHRFLPSVSAAAAAGSRGSLADEHRRTVRLVLVLVALPVAVFLAAPSPLMGALFGSVYTAAGPLLRVLTVAVVAEAVVGFHELVLLADGRERAVLALRVASQAAGAALVVALAPRFGAVGAAWAVVGMQTVRSAGLVWLARGAPVRATS